MAYSGVHLPVGYEVAVKNDSGTYVDLGVTNEEGTIEATYETVKWTGSRAEALKTFYKEFTVSATMSLAQIQLENINLLMSGGTAYDTVAASEVAGATQTLAGGEWAEDTWYKFDGQQAAGTAPTAISMENDGSLTAFEIVKVGAEWGFFVTDANDLAEDLVVTYTYTPAASKSLSMGSNSVDITPRAVRIRKNLGTQAAPKYFSVEIYSAVNEAGLSLSFPRYDADDISALEVTLTGNLDTTRSDLDQLLKITDETAA